MVDRRSSSRPVWSRQLAHWLPVGFAPRPQRTAKKKGAAATTREALGAFPLLINLHGGPKRTNYII